MSNQASPAPIGEVETPFGPCTILATRYPSGGAIAILLNDQEGEMFAVFSVNLVPYGSPVAPDCFHVKIWSENEPLVTPMLETGLFEPTGASAVTGHCVAPVWRLRDPSKVPTHYRTTH